MLFVQFIVRCVALMCVAATPSPTPCSQCSSEGLTNEQFINMKIAMEKKRILKRLNLSEPPKVKRSEIKIPPHLYEQLHNPPQMKTAFLKDEPLDSKTLRLDEGDSDTIKLFVSGKYADNQGSNSSVKMHIEVNLKYPTPQSNTASLIFEMTDRSSPNQMNSRRILNSFMWLKITPQSTTSQFVEESVKIVIDSKSTSAQLKHSNNRWLMVDMTNITEYIINNKTLALQVITNKNMILNFSIDPSMEIELGERISTRLRRSRRTVDENCSSTKLSHCCFSPVYINFSAPLVDWGDWIIRPEGFTSAYCTGNCLFPESYYSHFMSSVSRAHDDSLLMPCCTPKEFGPLKLLFALGPDNVTEAVLDNFIPRRCGC